MAETRAISGYGVLLKVGDGAATEVFAAIAELKNISGPGFELDVIDVTNMTSPDGFREFIGGLINPGELTFTLNFIPTDPTHSPATGLLKDMFDRKRRNYRLTFPVSPQPVNWTMPALVTNFSTDQPLDDAVTADVTLKITGKPTFA